MFTCTNCKVPKLDKDFQENERYALGHSTWCRDCHNKASRESRNRMKVTNPSFSRDAKIKTKYKLSPEAYDKKLEEQDGHCALCTAVAGKQRLHVDHSHECCEGKNSCGACVRGLLCSACNGLMGYFERFLNNVKLRGVIPGTWNDKALEYLVKYQDTSVTVAYSQKADNLMEYVGGKTQETTQ